MLTTNEKHWVLVRPDENGSPPLRACWLKDEDLQQVLANPHMWGIDEFRDVDALGNIASAGSRSPHWGILMRAEVVVPERAGWRLPTEDKWVRGVAPVAPVTLGDLHDAPPPIRVPGVAFDDEQGRGLLDVGP
jgi:hypothetical protein